MKYPESKIAQTPSKQCLIKLPKQYANPDMVINKHANIFEEPSFKMLCVYL
jgi:hypothetical protein